MFIHDPRISGPNDAYLYSVNDHKSGSGRGGGGVGSPFGRDTFYWPDMPRTDGDGKSVRSRVNLESAWAVGREDIFYAPSWKALL